MGIYVTVLRKGSTGAMQALSRRHKTIEGDHDNLSVEILPVPPNLKELNPYLTPRKMGLTQSSYLY